MEQAIDIAANKTLLKANLHLIIRKAYVKEGMHFVRRAFERYSCRHIAVLLHYLHVPTRVKDIFRNNTNQSETPTGVFQSVEKCLREVLNFRSRSY